MKEAELIVVKLNTVARFGNEHIGPIRITTEGPDFKDIIQNHFGIFLQGIAGYILVKYKGRLFQCERDNVNPSNPYVRHEVRYHPLANLFTRRKDDVKQEAAN